MVVAFSFVSSAFVVPIVAGALQAVHALVELIRLVRALLRPQGLVVASQFLRNG
jgi:hypothetical protein